MISFEDIPTELKELTENKVRGVSEISLVDGTVIDAGFFGMTTCYEPPSNTSILAE
jgi:hypothetical protein